MLFCSGRFLGINCSLRCFSSRLGGRVSVRISSRIRHGGGLIGLQVNSEVGVTQLEAALAESFIVRIFSVGRGRVERFRLKVQPWVHLLLGLGLIVKCFQVDLHTSDIWKITDLAALLLDNCDLLSGLILVDLLHEVSDLRVRIKEVNMVFSHDLSNGLF